MIDSKSFRGSYLLYRKAGAGMQRVKGDSGGQAPRFRHHDRASAETEAARLLGKHPTSTFLILQEVGRVMLMDPDAATSCADAQTFAAVPADLLRRIAQ